MNDAPSNNGRSKWQLSSVLDGFVGAARRGMVTPADKPHLPNRILAQIVEQAFNEGWRMHRSVGGDEPPEILFDITNGFPQIKYRWKPKVTP